ncbi:MAG TPA: secretion protein [Porticoccaceae bacterium]|nr:secretion protein [Porticoccaceae bacterium]
MNKLGSFTCGAVLALTPLVTTAADTLSDIYQLALTNDPTLRAANAAFNAGKESIPLGRAGILPKITASAEFTDGDGDRSNFRTLNIDGNSFESGAAGDNDDETESYSVSLSQPLFDLPAWFTFKQGYDLDQQAEAQFAADQQSTIVRVTEAYIDVLRANENLVTSLAEQRAIGRQLEQTKERFDVGLLPITDVHEAQAAYDSAMVNTLEAQSALDIAFEGLEVITGQRHQELAGLSSEFPIKETEPADSKSWVEFSQQNNFALEVSRLAMTAAEKTAKAKRAEHLPTLTASLGYSNFHRDGHFLRDDGNTQPFAEDDEPTVFSLRLDAPIFTGGLVSAERRKAYQDYLQAQELYLLKQRQITQQARSQHLSVSTDAARVKARKQAITSATSALEATDAGYEVGTRNIVDVLISQRVLYQAQRDYANARYDYIISMLKLREVAGQLSPEHLAELDRWLSQEIKINRAEATGAQ